MHSLDLSDRATCRYQAFCSVTVTELLHEVREPKDPMDSCLAGHESLNLKEACKNRGKDR